MTDTIPRQAVIDAIEGERLNEDTGSEGDAAYERALDDVIAAINAIPAVEQTSQEILIATRYALQVCGVPTVIINGNFVISQSTDCIKIVDGREFVEAFNNAM